MDITKLFYGDWVHCVTDNSNYQFGRMTRNHDCHCTVNEKLNFNFDIEPIPLSEDFFKNNGFETYDSNPHYLSYWRQKDNDFGNEIYNIEIDRNENDEDGEYHLEIRHAYHGSIRKKIKFIHELQHCLRAVDLSEIANSFEA